MKKVTTSILILFCSFYSVDLLAERIFVFDPNRHKWLAYEDGELVGDGPASGGKHYCPDVKRPCRTPAGTYRVHGKRGVECYSKIYPLNKKLPRAKMPYCSFFHRGFAIHGSNSVPGYNASHGCIRVPTEDARWLHHNFLSLGTTVVVKPYSSRGSVRPKSKEKARPDYKARYKQMQIMRAENEEAW